MLRNFVRVLVSFLLAISLVPVTQASAVTSTATSVRDLQVNNVQAHSVHLSWSAPSWGADGITDYQVEYKTTTESSWSVFSHTASTNTEITVTGLTAGANYNFRVSPVIANSTQPARTLGIKQVVVGMSHACALSDAGEVSCWGDNSFGQLGNSDSSVTSSATPVRVSGVSAIALTSGRDHTCALIVDGTIACWGSNTNGQLGTGDTSYQFSATPRLVSGITNATNVAAGAMHACAVIDGGAVKCWGAGAKYRLGLAASYAQNDVATPTSVVGLAGLTAVQVSGGTSQSCALLSTKAIKCWGDNASGQLGAGATSSATPSPRAVSGIDGSAGSAVQVSMGSQHACAVLTDGTAKCWGNGGSGRIGNGATTTAATAATVKMGGSVLTGIRTIAAGAESSCAIINSGEVVCWGNNASGQLGNGTLVSQSQAVSTGITNAVAIAADLGSNVSGTGHNCALLSDSTVKCWGTGANYVLGNGLTFSSSSPVLAVVGTPSSVKPVGVPDAPVWHSITPKLRALELNWELPASNGSALTAVNVKYSGGTLDGQTACAVSVTDTSCIISNLDPAQTYAFAISATNGIGSSPATISTAVSTQTTGETNGFTWQDTANTMSITGCTYSCQDLIIPSTIQADPVVAIGPNAFTNNTVSSVTLPNSISSIAPDAFGAQKLPITNLNNFGVTLTGSGKVGTSLTATGTSWLSTATKQYVWLRDGQVIAGATTSRYVVTPDDFGKAVSAIVTLRKTGFVSTSLRSAPISTVAGVIPVTANPSVVGVFRVGQSLSARSGNWSAGTEFSYRWLANGSAIAGATVPNYTLGLDDLGKTVSVEITGTKFGYESRTRVSTGHVVLPGVQVAITDLHVVGAPKVGQVLASSLSGDQYRYQWLRNSLPISGATSSSYTPTLIDAGKYLSVRVTKVQLGYLDAVAIAKASGVTTK